jgi:hypothetical protein
VLVRVAGGEVEEPGELPGERREIEDAEHVVEEALHVQGVQYRREQAAVVRCPRREQPLVEAPVRRRLGVRRVVEEGL